MKPQKKINGITFFPIPEFTDVQMAFGASIDHYFNRYDPPEIPRKYTDMASSLFFSGGSLPEMHPAVDKKKALRALKALLGSFNPAHEAKEATVGYALWLWTHPTALD